MTPKERNAILYQFNNSDAEAMVLITTSAVGGAGINCQFKCWNVHILETPYSDAMRVQNIGRVRRLNNPSRKVKVWEYYVNDTFDTKKVNKQLEKMLPKAMALLSREAINGIEGDT